MTLRQSEEEILKYYQWLEKCYDEAHVFYLKSLEGQDLNNDQEIQEQESDQYKYWKP